MSGPNNVACCWPKMLHPFGWALTVRPLNRLPGTRSESQRKNGWEVVFRLLGNDQQSVPTKG